MSKRARLLFVFGCLGVSALHLPSAARSARAGLRGPYGGAAAFNALAAIAMSDSTASDSTASDSTASDSTASDSMIDSEAPRRLSSNLPRFVRAVGRDEAWAPLVSEGM